jgi:hypothetical protein
MSPVEITAASPRPRPLRRSVCLQIAFPLFNVLHLDWGIDGAQPPASYGFLEDQNLIIAASTQGSFSAIALPSGLRVSCAFLDEVGQI